MSASLVGSEMCIRDRVSVASEAPAARNSVDWRRFVSGLRLRPPGLASIYFVSVASAAPANRSSVDVRRFMSRSQHRPAGFFMSISVV
eukprot:4663212-Alexandrium_andersonii.AAC.1